MSNTGDDAQTGEWTPHMLDLARIAFPAVLEETPEGEKHELCVHIIKKVATQLATPVDEDALSDDLDPFSLFDETLRVVADNGSEGFMGPSYCVFTVLKIRDDSYLVIEDHIESGEYEVLEWVSSLHEACPVIGKHAVDRLGKEINIDETAVDLSQTDERSTEFWVRVLLGEADNTK